MASQVKHAIQSLVKSGVMAVSSFNRSRVKPLSTPHPYLSGVHTPLKEEFSLTSLVVEGDIPEELNGTYLRIGPNPVEPPNTGNYHWFVGDGMVHGIRIEDGRPVWYKNRWVRSKDVSRVLGEDPRPGPRRERTDTVNTNIIGHAGDLWALVEAGAYPVRLDDDLNTIAHDPFGGTLSGSYTAHPHKDPQTGELHSICYEAGQPDVIRYVRVDAEGKVIRDVPIAVEHGPSIHDCTITENYVIILDLPVTFSLKSVIQGDRFPYKWNDNHASRVGLLPRDGSGDEVIWCPVDPCYVFHQCNAYETEDGQVILDVCAHASMFKESRVGPEVERSPFERWTIDPARQTVDRFVLDEMSQEFPRHDERFTSRPYRYAYCLGLNIKDGDVIGLDGSMLYKHDLLKNQIERYSFGDGTICGEFIFIPRHNTSPEGDGWLMGLVLEPENNVSKLYIIDAQDFSKPPQAAITIPHIVPPGFHGNWVTKG